MNCIQYNTLYTIENSLKPLRPKPIFTYHLGDQFVLLYNTTRASQHSENMKYFWSCSNTILYNKRLDFTFEMEKGVGSGQFKVLVYYTLHLFYNCYGTCVSMIIMHIYHLNEYILYIPIDSKAMLIETSTYGLSFARYDSTM